MKKLVVKDDVCIGCGACIAIDSKHFDFDEQGLSSVINNEDLDAAELTNAISSCPVSAIKLIDEEDNETGAETHEEGACEGCDGSCGGHCHHE